MRTEHREAAMAPPAPSSWAAANDVAPDEALGCGWTAPASGHARCAGRGFIAVACASSVGRHRLRCLVRLATEAKESWLSSASATAVESLESSLSNSGTRRPSPVPHRRSGVRGPVGHWSVPAAAGPGSRPWCPVLRPRAGTNCGGARSSFRSASARRDRCADAAHDCAEAVPRLRRLARGLLPPAQAGGNGVGLRLLSNLGGQSGCWCS